MARNSLRRRELPPPTQDQIIVKEFIQEDIALLKDGTLVQVVEVGACDMDAMSEPQQNWILGQFQAFLMGLKFPIQIAIASEHQNIYPWLETLLEDVQEWEKKLSISPDGTEREVLKRLKARASERVEWVKRLHGRAQPQVQRYYLVLYVNPLPLRTSRREFTEALCEKAKEDLARNRFYVVENLRELGLAPRVLREADMRAILSHFYKRRIPPLHVTPKRALFSLMYSSEEAHRTSIEWERPAPTSPDQRRYPSPDEGRDDGQGQPSLEPLQGLDGLPPPQFFRPPLHAPPLPSEEQSPASPPISPMPI